MFLKDNDVVSIAVRFDELTEQRAQCANVLMFKANLLSATEIIVPALHRNLTLSLLSLYIPMHG